MSPERAILIQSPGRKPWVNHRNTFIEPQRGLLHNTAEINTRAVVPLLKELILRFVSVYPGFHFGLCPHFTLGFEEVSCLRHSILPPPNQSHTTTHPFVSNNTRHSNFNGIPIQIQQYAHSCNEPFRAILIQSPGRKPWVNHWNTFIEPQRGGTLFYTIKKACAKTEVSAQASI